MITITSLGEQTVQAIKAGHDTNEKLCELLGGTTASVGCRVAKLRKQGLVLSKRMPGPKSHMNNQPLVYTLLEKKYRVSDDFLRGPRKGIKPHKTYAGMGEEVFDNLNGYLYPGAKA